mmetsp:Transcript_44953/g.95839  ORF Transcript_44953/g.95839 Transcript_44953/m.95839 type:complete len:1232 (+) Transcript_44953:79-3774(+)
MVEVGAFVEIHGLEGKQVHTAPLAYAEDPDKWVSKNVDGQKGQCTEYDAENGEYVVHTFEGFLASVPEANLKLFDPPLAEDGGFDLLWPSGDAEEEFGEMIGQALARKGYCVIQTSLSAHEREEAVADAKQVKDTQEFKEELELDYLGRDNTTKTLKLKDDDPLTEPSDILGSCDRHLSDLGAMLAPVAEGYLNIDCVGRSPGLVRVPFSSKAEQSRLKSEPLMDDDIEEGLVAAHIAWVQSRKICMMYLIDNEGGEMQLFKKDGEKVTLPIERNKLLVFRHDTFSYSYKPMGESLAVQSWMLTATQSIEVKRVTGPAAEMDLAQDIKGPPRAVGLQMQIMTMMTRFPGVCQNPDMYWAMLSYCTDCDTEWPFGRYDQGLYYMEGPDASIMGKSYTKHSGHLTDEQLYGFDNKFFNITDAEAQCMSTNQRNSCEVIYDTLQQRGFTPKSLNGKAIGIYVGDVGSDWHSYTPFSSLAHWNPDLSATAVSSALVPTRMSYVFNMQGPTMTFDTACSASLVATHHAHMGMINWKIWGKPCDGAVCGGTNSVGPIGYVGNCSASMLSHIGRSFTYDRTADGYQRGEGTGMFYMHITDDLDEIENRLAALIGSCANQDGRSASLTAPNGPSQQAVIRHSLKMGGIDAEHVTAVECHGTGTALGDPIEVGAIMAVMEGERDDPLPHTSAKSNISHLESAAGVAGLLKCIVFMMRSVATPNVHIKALNPHLESQGFPQLFESECVDTGFNAGCTGVSSFGFGGTNSRADIYIQCKEGPRARPVFDAQLMDYVTTTCPRCLGLMCWKCKAAIPTNAPKERHRCSLIRDEFSDYEFCSNCYYGDIRHGEAIEDLALTFYQTLADVKVSMVGTWSAWSELDEMELNDEGAYCICVTLGETRQEQFQIVLNEYNDQVIHPVCGKATSSTALAGPEATERDKCWLIDGIKEGQPAGTVYLVKLYWEEGKKNVCWEPVSGEPPNAMASMEYKHKYFISGSFTQEGANWKRKHGMMEMTANKEQDGLFECEFQIGGDGYETFQFLRDRDWDQVIYPAVGKAEVTSVPVRGPDDASCGKMFMVRGTRGEQVKVSVSVIDARVVVMATSLSIEQRIWESAPLSEPRHTYAVTGDFNDWSLSPMTEENGKFTYRLSIGANWEEDFQIVVDNEWSMTLHPMTADAGKSGEVITKGPDSEGDGLNWVICGEEGMEVEIVLDLENEDRRKVVTWRPIWEPYGSGRQALADE